MGALVHIFLIVLINDYVHHALCTFFPRSKIYPIKPFISSDTLYFIGLRKSYRNLFKNAEFNSYDRSQYAWFFKRAAKFVRRCVAIDRIMHVESLCNSANDALLNCNQRKFHSTKRRLCKSKFSDTEYVHNPDGSIAVSRPEINEAFLQHCSSALDGVEVNPVDLVNMLRGTGNGNVPNNPNLCISDLKEIVKHSNLNSASGNDDISYAVP